MKLGCIADDYTGATDLAGLLRRSGASVRLHFGLPKESSDCSSDIEIIARVSPELANEWPFPFLNGDEAEPFSVRIMHRMNIEGTLILDGLSPIYYYDSTVDSRSARVLLIC